LSLLIDAAQRNDLAEFQQRIDDDEIAKNMVASVSQKAAGRYGFALNSSVQGQIDATVPSLLPRLKQTIHDEVVNEIKEFASKSSPKPFIFLVVAVPSLMTVTTEGDTAKATAKLSDRTIELALRRDAERWKVTDFKDDVVVQRVVDNVMKELPAVGGVDSSSPLLKQSTRGKPRRRR
jgi:rRNA maturation endonuclease Nob1